LQPITLAVALALAPGFSLGAPPLPVPCAGGPCGVNAANLPFVQSGAAAFAANAAQTAATITQTSQSSILNWQSFNIGVGNSVQFTMPSATAQSLNRIWQADPSVIAGALRSNVGVNGPAGGQIYLINQNGIIFSGGAQVNVGSLVASTLNISDDLFLNGVLSNLTPASVPAFSVFTNGQPTGLVSVEAGADLRSASGGRIMLLAPQVANAGSITTPDGQTILAAGGKVYLAASSDPKLRGLLVEVDSGGAATNLGNILAERGNATIVGLAVNQQGRVKATTSVSQNGSILLLARDTVQEVTNAGGGANLPRGSNTGAVTFGTGSVTEVQPETDSSQTILDGQSFYPSTVTALGRSIEMQSGSAILAPGGAVSLTAQAGLEFRAAGPAPVAGARIYLAPGSVIDVSGERDVDVPIERNLIQVQLRGDELKDSPLQRDGFLRGKTITVDARLDPPTPLANVSGYLAQIPRTVAERSSTGGTIALAAEGDIVLRQGSTLNVSGGNIRYLDGYMKTTQLVSDGVKVDIGSASPDRIYTGFADSYTVSYGRWGVTETFQSYNRGVFTPGYTEGKSAGVITLNGAGLALDGALLGGAAAGPNQRSAATLPAGGMLVIGDPASNLAQPDYRIGNFAFVNAPAPLPDSFGFGSPLLGADVTLPAGLFDAGRFTRLSAYANGTVTIGAGIGLTFGPGGALALTGSAVNVAGSVWAPGGRIALASADTFGSSLQAADHGLRLAPGARLDARGLWVNDSPQTGADATAPTVVKGGTISLASVADLNLEAGSALDVSGGAWLSSAGKLTPGDAGSIALSTGRYGVASGFALQTSVLRLGGELSGYAIGKGGRLTLSASSLRIGGAPTAVPGELYLDSAFFGQNGFKDYSLNGTDGITVAANAKLLPSAQSLLLDPLSAYQPGGAGIAAFAKRAELEPALRSPQTLTLNAGGQAAGRIDIGAGALLAVDPQGSIQLGARQQITLNGSLKALAGTVGLTLAAASEGEYQNGNAIWLGAGGKILAGGYPSVVPDARGLRSGSILNGGAVTLNAGRGFVVSQAGSIIDVSGTSGTLDIVQDGTGGRVPLPTVVASDAGSVTIAARDGFLLDGGISARPGGANARGGALAVSFNYPSSIPGYPAAARMLRLQSGGNAVPAGLLPGQAFPVALAGRGVLDMARTEGFDALSAASPGSIEIAGGTNLSLRRSIVLDAPVIAAKGAGTGTLTAAYVLLGNRDVTQQALQGPVTATAGTGPASDDYTATLGGYAYADGALIAFAGTASSSAPTLSVNGLLKKNVYNTANTGFASVAAGETVYARYDEASDRFVVQAPGSLRVNATAIDLEGKLALQLFDSVSLKAVEDIRGQGIQNGVNGRDLTGTFSVDQALTLQARQVYPATFSDFRIESRGTAGTITVLGNGAPTPVLSAGGALTLSAPVIAQHGIVKAPFGGIVLNGAQSVTLGADSVTSVSGEGQVVPFGRTELSGIDYAYALGTGNSVQLAAPPQKTVRLSSASVTVAAGAKVDVSGGGELYAYEFVPGPGGSRDLLSPSVSPNSYAVIPGFASSYAPRDYQYENGTVGLSPGDRVYLSGAAGLPAGTYTLLPARYALLPGAFLVTASGGVTDLPASANSTAVSGVQTVSGYRVSATNDGSLARDARSSSFVVMNGAQVRSGAQYNETTGSAYFASTGGVQLPGDAGRLAVAATQSLALDGSLLTARAAGGRGAEVDITAPNLAVVSAGGAAPGVPLDGTSFLQISADKLNALGASSLLLGGTRAISASGTAIDVGAGEVAIANTGAQALAAPEVLLAATGRVSLRANASVQGADGFSGTPRDIVIGAAGGASGEGALLRVSSSAQPGLARNNVNAANPSRGILDVDATANVSGRSVMLDATRSNSFRGTLALAANGELALGANRISVDGRAGGSAVTSGLVFSNQRLADLGNPASLLLRSYSTLDLLGPAVLGTSSLAKLTVEAGGIGGYQNAGTATLRAQSVALQNPSGIAFSSAPVLQDGSPPAAAAGNLLIDAQGSAPGAGLSLGAGAFTIGGFASGTTLSAQREVVATASGSLAADAGLTVQASRLGVANGAAYAVALSAGTFTTALPAVPASDLGLAPLGGQLAVSAPTIAHGGNIELPSGYVALNATGAAGANGAGSVTLSSGSRLSVAGRGDPYFDRVVPSPGGEVQLASANGNVSVQAGTGGPTVDVSGAPGADAGRLTLSAPSGSVQVAVQADPLLAPTLAGRALAAPAGTAGSAVPRQGEFILDTGTLASFSDLNKTLEAGGVTERRDLRVRNGGVTIDGGVAVHARNFQLAADTGNIELKGDPDGAGPLLGASIDASGPKGGTVSLLAGGDLLLRAGSSIDARGTQLLAAPFGTQGEGGTVLLSSASTTGQVLVEANSVIDVSAASAASGVRGGTVTYRAARIADPVVPSFPTPGTGGTQNNFTVTSGYAGVTSYTPGLVIAFTANRNITGTTAVTLNVNSLGARPVFNNDTPAVAGAFASGQPVYAIYDGSSFHLTTLAMAASDVGKDMRLTSSAGVFTGALANTVYGASSVVAEATRIYDSALIGGYGTQSGGDLTITRTGVLAGMTARFMGNAAAIEARLGKGGDPGFHLQPGLEVRSGGNLTVQVNEADTFLYRRGWNFGSAAWRFGGEPGVLTLRAAGDVNLNSSVSDGLNPLGTSASNGRLMQEWFQIRADDSWSYRIAAGADLAAANPLAVNRAGTGSFNLAADKLLRTGNGSIRVAAAGNLSLANAGSVIYTVGVSGPSLADFPSLNLGTLIVPVVVNPQFPMSGGDISLSAGGSVIAAASEQLITGWLQRNGVLDSGGLIANSGNPAWWPRFDAVRQGIAAPSNTVMGGGFRQGVGALGGGDVTVEAGGEIRNLSVSTPTNGRLPGASGSAPDGSRLVVQAGGDISVRSGADIASGVFYADRGAETIVARGSIGQAAGSTVSTIVALGDATAQLRAGRNLTLDGVLNPTVLAEGPVFRASVSSPSTPARGFGTSFFTYSPSSAVDLTALGSISLLNRTTNVRLAYSTVAPGLPAGNTSYQQFFNSSNVDALKVYPGSLTARALGGSFTASGDFTLYPSASGNLAVYASGAIGLPVNIAMSDVNPAALPQATSPVAAFSAPSGGTGPRAHSDPSLHALDAEPVRVYSEAGDITGVSGRVLQLAKQARIYASGNITDLSLSGQNVSDTDLTRLAAGGSISFTPVRDAFGVPQPGAGAITLGGPGRLELIAGGGIDLSTSSGVVTRGSLDNPFLSADGASILALAGAKAIALNGPPRVDAAAFLTDGVAADALPPIRLTKADLAAHVLKMTGDTSVDASNALVKFNALSADLQWPLVVNALFTALRDTGRDAAQNGAGYGRGYAAIGTLFPGSGFVDPGAAAQAFAGSAASGAAANTTASANIGSFYGNVTAAEKNPLVQAGLQAYLTPVPGRSYKGDINLFFSQIKTEQGGDIQLLAPGGLVNAGLANSGSFSKSAASLGVVTVRGGSVESFVRGDFLVNQSRVFTLQGGDILIWASEGDIDAGKGAKTASATPPPVLRVDSKGNISLDTSQSVSGSGIGVLLAREDVKPGDVDLIAPNGVVNAGDAGIRVAGNLTIAAVRVIGADNISAGGRATGVPVAAASGPAAGVLGSAGAAASAAQGAADAARGGASGQGQGFRPSFITVEVIGLGT
jgi:filamentous hemagglutinin family protein